MACVTYEYLALAQASRMIHDEALTPLALVEGCLERINLLNPELNAFLTVMSDQALSRAQSATEAIQRGEDWGSLHGIPIGVKDIIDVVGVPMTAGSDFLRNNVAEDDAEVVRRLRGAGAIIIGKTHLHEFALGATSENPHYGPVRNPWNTNHTPGGSSGGSGAAVAAGLCLGALGSDTGGSVRIPSSFCNLTGLRPGKNQISTQGVVPLTWSLDTIGPMADSVHDIALMLDALEMRRDSYVNNFNKSVSSLRIGVPVGEYFEEDTDGEVTMHVRMAIKTLVDLGMQSTEVSLPLVNKIREAAGIILITEAAAYHQGRLETEPERFGLDVRQRLENARDYTAIDYALARQTAREWRAVLRTMFQDTVDVIALPTMPIPAPAFEGLDSVSDTSRMVRFTHPFTMSALPCLSMPCGFTSAGLPIGIQLVAPRTELLLQVAHAYQQNTDWATRRPDL